MKEKILDTFKTLGFKLEDMDGYGYEFMYEGKPFLYLYNENNEDFLNIALPILADIDVADISFYKMMDNLNSNLKYVKANILNNSLFLFYERELFGDEDFEQVIKSMIVSLDAGNFYYKHRFKKNNDNDNVDNSEEKEEETEKSSNEDNE